MWTMRICMHTLQLCDYTSTFIVYQLALTRPYHNNTAGIIEEFLYEF